MATWLSLPSMMGLLHSHLNHEHMHLWLLAPDGVDRTAHRALDGARDDIGVGPRGWRPTLESLKDRIIDQRVARRTFSRAVRPAADHDVRVPRHLASCRQSDRDRD